MFRNQRAIKNARYVAAQMLFYVIIGVWRIVTSSVGFFRVMTLELFTLLVVLAGLGYDGKSCDFFVIKRMPGSAPRCAHVETWHPSNFSNLQGR